MLGIEAQAEQLKLLDIQEKLGRQHSIDNSQTLINVTKGVSKDGHSFNIYRWKCLICGVEWETTDATREVDIQKYTKQLSSVQLFKTKVIQCPCKELHGKIDIETLQNGKLAKQLKDASDILYNEYDKQRNYKKVENVTIGDTHKRRWICRNCGYAWYEAPIDRIDTETLEVIHGCVKCEKKSKKDEHGWNIVPRQVYSRNMRGTGKKQVQGLAYSRPELMPYFDSENNSISLYQISNKTAMNIHWRCFRCGYEWTHKPAVTFPKHICPACQGKLIQGFNDYRTMEPDRYIDLNYDWNKVQASQIHHRLKAKLHWKCHKCGHTFVMSPLDTIEKKRTCPVCNTLKDKWPDATEHIKDKQLDTSKIKGDQLKETEWVCDKGHTYRMKVIDRTTNWHGCPYCRTSENWVYTRIKRCLDDYGIRYDDYASVGTTRLIKLLDKQVLLHIDTRYGLDGIETKQKYIKEKIDELREIGYTIHTITEMPDKTMLDLHHFENSWLVPMEYQDIFAETIVQWIEHYA